MNDISWNLKDLVHNKEGLKVFSTFACGGGSTMGYKRAGCHVLGANDIDPVMAKHYKKNHNPELYYLCPIKDLLTIDLDPRLYDLDILDGSPPCSSFSMAGSREKAWGKEKKFREGQAVQVLDDLFFDYLNLVDRLRPKVAIAENVKGMLIGNAKGYTKAVIKRFKEMGYRPQVFLINAVNCGVPQKRERVFFCAVREDVSNKKLILNPRHRVVTVGDAIKDIQKLTTEENELTKFTANTDKNWWYKTMQGERYADAVMRDGHKEKLWNHKKLSLTQPSNTLAATHGNFNHPTESRKLTLREFKRLGSFPDDYWAESDDIGKYMIGMSVPPKMTEQVAKAVIEQWLT